MHGMNKHTNKKLIFWAVRLVVILAMSAYAFKKAAIVLRSQRMPAPTALESSDINHISKLTKRDLEEPGTLEGISVSLVEGKDSSQARDLQTDFAAVMFSSNPINEGAATDITIEFTRFLSYVQIDFGDYSIPWAYGTNIRPGTYVFENVVYPDGDVTPAVTILGIRWNPFFYGVVTESLVVNNVPPCPTYIGSLIIDDATGAVSGDVEINDPGTRDFGSFVVDWGDGRSTTYWYTASTTGTQTVNIAHAYTVTVSTDQYTATITATDKDRDSCSETVIFDESATLAPTAAPTRDSNPFDIPATITLSQNPISEGDSVTVTVQVTDQLDDVVIDFGDPSIAPSSRRRIRAN